MPALRRSRSGPPCWRGTSPITCNVPTKGYHARVTLWRLEKGTWRKRLRARDGRIGYNGLVRPRKRVQGSGKTPLGTFRLPWAFGMHRKKAGWDEAVNEGRAAAEQARAEMVSDHGTAEGAAL